MEIKRKGSRFSENSVYEDEEDLDLVIFGRKSKSLKQEIEEKVCLHSENF